MRHASSHGDDRGGVLFILAHPDDETFLCGGTIARYASEGIAVHCVCATRGERGTMAPATSGEESVADVRSEELMCAARTLGVVSVRFLDYRDSGMRGSPHADHPQALAIASRDEVSRRIVTIIRTIRPQLVVTHGPFGEYGHPDHIRLHEAVCRAYVAAGEPVSEPSEPAPWSPDALYVIALNPVALRWAIRMLRLIRRDPHRFGENADIDLATTLEHVVPATCVVDVARWSAIRNRARRCHRSQSGGRSAFRRLADRLPRWFGRTERYARWDRAAQAAAANAESDTGNVSRGD